MTVNPINMPDDDFVIPTVALDVNATADVVITLRRFGPSGASAWSVDDQVEVFVSFLWTDPSVVSG